MVTVEQVIRDLGGQEAIRQRGAEFREAFDFFASQEDDLIAKHPYQWVAVTAGKELALGDSLEGVLAEAERRGLRSSVLLVRLLDPDPPTLFL